MTSSAPPSLSISPGWSLALGILLVIAGIVALLFPMIATVTVTLYIGWFAIIAGVIDLVVSWRTRNEPNLGWRIATGILYLVLGFLLAAHPVAGAATLALFVGAVMAAAGVVEIMLAMRHKPKRGWGWLVASGIIAILFAILIVIGWPAQALILIGYLIGFQIISCGVARIALAMAAKKPSPAVA